MVKLVACEKSPVLPCRIGLLVADPTPLKSFQISCLSVDLFLNPYKKKKKKKSLETKPTLEALEILHPAISPPKNIVFLLVMT